MRGRERKKRGGGGQEEYDKAISFEKKTCDEERKSKAKPSQTCNKISMQEVKTRQAACKKGEERKREGKNYLISKLVRRSLLGLLIGPQHGGGGVDAL